MPAVSFASSFIPGVGPLISKGLDIVGNVLPDAEATSAPSPAAAAFNFGSLGTSPASVALANANGFLGIGGSAPGVFGIGDGKPGVAGIGDGLPGVFGIGTGANAARNAAETAALSNGATPAAAKAAGESAAQAVKDAPAAPAGESSINPLYLIGGALLALLAL